MNEEITDVKPPMGFPHITDLAGSEATILQVANSQGDILGYATLNDIDAYIEQKVSETVHSFSQKQIFQDVTINGTFDGNNVVNQSKLNGALGSYQKTVKYLFGSSTGLSKDSLCEALGLSKQAGALILSASSRNISASGVQLAFMYWFDTNSVGLRNIFVTENAPFVTLQNDSITGLDSLYGFSYTIALSVLDVIPVYY